MKPFFTVITLFLPTLCHGMPTETAKAGSPKPEPKRVLFIGNSYTAQNKGTLLQLLADSPHNGSTFEFITKGGAKLAQHLANEATVGKIKNGNWDFVVLQEQSQTPALPGKHGESFQQSVDQFSKLIREAGAEPILFMTWGRRDGDKKNISLFPDFGTMQTKLTTAYQEAAGRNHLIVAPVGLAWAAAREKAPSLGKELYRNDGSHPSAKGAILATIVLLGVIFQDTIELTNPPEGISPQEFAIIKQASSSAIRN
jgi:hypothetical protein